MLENGTPERSEDTLYLKISDTIKDFGDISDIEYDENDELQQKIVKAATVISGEKIYSHSFTQI